jgi:pyruvate ferredoxin oxidoreductase beta subunit
MAIDCGIFDLYEIDEGEFRFTGQTRKNAEKGIRNPVEEYIRSQDRFRTAPDSVVEEIQRAVDKKWDKYQKMGYCEAV